MNQTGFKFDSEHDNDREAYFYFVKYKKKNIIIVVLYMYTPNQEKNLELFKFIKVSFWCTYFQGVKRKNVLGICLHLLKVGIKYLQLSEILFKRQKERERVIKAVKMLTYILTNLITLW